ncbi:MAG: Mu transposase C-terminal domain-containing protein [Deltaproteobacteria bacterium]|nr:Mu transposase C-terminal domain-containing protein [Deltaproteobacteria bacterium]
MTLISLLPERKTEPAKREVFDLKLWEREELEKRETIVKEFINASQDIPRGRKQAFKEDVAKRHGISVSTLERWLKAYLENGRYALVPDWNNGSRDGVIDPETAKYIENTYLKPFGPTIKETWEKLRTTFPDKPISYRTVANHIQNRWSESQQLLIRNKEVWDRLYSPHVRRDWMKCAVNEVWIGDAKQIDVCCFFNGRIIFPWLTVLMDARSRKFVGWVLTPVHNSWSIAQSFVYAVREHGVPKVIYIDRGKPYKSLLVAGKRLKQGKIINLFSDIEETGIPGIVRDMGCELFFAAPYNAREKIIEPNFGIFTDRLRHLSGYRGHSVKTRPKKLEQEIKSGKLLSFNELLQEIDRIINDRNARPHSTTGEPPNSFYESHTFPIPSERYLAYLLMDARVVKVRNSGVNVSGMFYRSEDLWKLAGESVEVRRDPKDLTRAAIIYKGKLFGFAELEEPDHYRGPKTLEARLTCARIRKKIKKYQKAIIESEELIENPLELDIEPEKVKLRSREIREPSPKVQSIHTREKLAKEVLEGLQNQELEPQEGKKAAVGGLDIMGILTRAGRDEEEGRGSYNLRLVDDLDRPFDEDDLKRGRRWKLKQP